MGSYHSNWIVNAEVAILLGLLKKRLDLYTSQDAGASPPEVHVYLHSPLLLGGGWFIWVIFWSHSLAPFLYIPAPQTRRSKKNDFLTSTHGKFRCFLGPRMAKQKFTQVTIPDSKGGCFGLPNHHQFKPSLKRTSPKRLMVGRWLAFPFSDALFSGDMFVLGRGIMSWSWILLGEKKTIRIRDSNNCSELSTSPPQRFLQFSSSIRNLFILVEDHGCIEILAGGTQHPSLNEFVGKFHPIFFGKPVWYQWIIDCRAKGMTPLTPHSNTGGHQVVVESCGWLIRGSC